MTEIYSFDEAREAWGKLHRGLQKHGMESAIIETLADYFANVGTARPDAGDEVERLRGAAQAMLTAVTTRALRGRDHVPSMRDEQDASSSLRAALAAMREGERGMVSVPREPTEAMLKAGQTAADDHRWKWCGLGTRKEGEGLDGMMFHVRDAYAAMLATALEQPR